MAELVKLIPKDSALSSWEGYNYQKSISMYIFLLKIKELLNKDEDIENSKLNIEIEGAEDFSIKDGEKYLSLHQVKSGAIKAEDNDKFCFVMSILQYGYPKGFYHINTKENFPKNFIKQTIVHIDKLITKLEQDICSKKDIDDKEKDNYIVIEKINKKAKKGSIYEVLNFMLVESVNNKVNVEIKTKELKDVLSNYKNLLYSCIEGEKNECLDDELLKAHNDRFDSVSEINVKTIETLKEILKNSRYEEILSDENYENIVFLKVQELFDNEITRATHDKNGKVGSISIIELDKVLSTDYREEMNTTEYYCKFTIHKIQELFADCTKELCSRESCFLCDKEDKKTYYNCNLRKEIKNIKKMQKKDIEFFITNLLLEKIEYKNQNNMASNQQIEDILFEVLKEIRLLKINKNKIIGTRKDKYYFRLSLYNGKKTKRLRENIIKLNNEYLETLYESDVIITDRVNEKNFRVDGNRFDVLKEDDLEKISSLQIENDKVNINKSKIFRIIDADTAKKELG